jgi:hypothetical protein
MSTQLQTTFDELPSFEATLALVSTLARRFQSDRATSRSKSDEPKPRVMLILGAQSSTWFERTQWDQLKLPFLRAAAACFPDKGKFYERLFWELSATHSIRAFSNPKAAEEALANDRGIRTEAIAEILWRHRECRDALEGVLRATFEPGANDAGPVPQLGAELIAHWAKHRFIDAIVTLNFDRTIDVALENELGQGAFHRVISDQSEPIPTGDERPCLIKLHGSTCTPGTLRFTQGQVGLLPPLLIENLDRAAFGTSIGRSISGRRSARLPKVTVLSLGYSWNDQGLAAWIRLRAKLIDCVYVVKRSTDEVPLLKGDDLRVQRIVATELVTEGDDVPNVDQFLWAVTTELNDKCSKTPPKGWMLPPVARHLLLAHLFGRPVKESSIESREYAGVDIPGIDYRNPHTAAKRFRAELLLHALKRRGMVNAETLATDARLRRYSNELCEKRKISPKQAFLQAVGPHFNEGTRVGEIGVFYAKGSLNQFAEYFTPAGSAGIHEDYQFSDPEDGPVSRVPWLNRVSKKLEFQPGLPGSKFFETAVETIIGAPAAEVRGVADETSRWVFRAAIPCLTHNRATERVVKLARRSDAEFFLVIDDDPDWLAEVVPKKGRQSRAFLVIESGGYSDEYLACVPSRWRQRVGNLDGCKYGRLLPWWRHNRHMSLVISREGKMLGGLFSTARLRESYSSPVYLEQPDDCIQLLRLFASYLVQTKGIEGDGADSWAGCRDAFLLAVKKIAEHYPGSEEVRVWTNSVRNLIVR